MVSKKVSETPERTTLQDGDIFYVIDQEAVAGNEDQHALWSTIKSELSNTVILPSGDNSGATDAAAIQAAIDSSENIFLVGGAQYYANQNFNIGSLVWDSVGGQATIDRVGATDTTQYFITADNGVVKNLRANIYLRARGVSMSNKRYMEVIDNLYLYQPAVNGVLLYDCWAAMVSNIVIAQGTGIGVDVYRFNRSTFENINIVGGNYSGVGNCCLKVRTTDGALFDVVNFEGMKASFDPSYQLANPCVRMETSSMCTFTTCTVEQNDFEDNPVFLIDRASRPTYIGSMASTASNDNLTSLVKTVSGAILTIEQARCDPTDTLVEVSGGQDNILNLGDAVGIPESAKYQLTDSAMVLNGAPVFLPPSNDVTGTTDRANFADLVAKLPQGSDTIHLDGYYYFDQTIDETNLTIIGAPGTTWRYAGTSISTFCCRFARIFGVLFMCQNNSHGPSVFPAIGVGKAVDNVNVFQATDYGLLINSAESASIENVEIRSCAGAYAFTSTGAASNLQIRNVAIRDCTNTTNCFYVPSTSVLTVEGVLIKNSTAGGNPVVYFADCTALRVSNMRIQGCDLTGSTGAVRIRNATAGRRGPQSLNAIQIDADNTALGEVFYVTEASQIVVNGLFARGVATNLFRIFGGTHVDPVLHGVDSDLDPSVWINSTGATIIPEPQPT